MSMHVQRIFSLMQGEDRFVSDRFQNYAEAERSAPGIVRKTGKSVFIMEGRQEVAKVIPDVVMNVRIELTWYGSFIA